MELCFRVYRHSRSLNAVVEIRAYLLLYLIHSLHSSSEDDDQTNFRNHHHTLSAFAIDCRGPLSACDVTASYYFCKSGGGADDDDIRENVGNVQKGSLCINQHRHSGSMAKNELPSGLLL